ncbi:MAG: hypothetical protein HDT20_00865 [Oscillibacter sp.]|nr:hypothetical protein [Oscillibacter sp.]
MDQRDLVSIITEQTNRALWEVQNVIDCVPDPLWDKAYCDAPCWQHIYHMLHSLDLWYMNPQDRTFQEPDIHRVNLNNLDIPPDITLSREQINAYMMRICNKIRDYLSSLTEEQLLEYPPDCEYCRFTLILAQFRHLHSHMGMLMGFIIGDTGLWPRVLGLEGAFPEGEYDKYL